MAFRATTRTPTFRPQLSMRRVYETMEPPSEMKETPEAYLLRVYLPGFARDRVKITYEGNLRRVKITGERPIQGNRWSRFDQSYPIPPNCEAEALQGKFDLGVLILTIPKVIPQVAPKQPEVETIQDHKGVAEAKPDEKGQETIPPQQPTTTKVEEPIQDKKSASLPSPTKDLVDLNSQKSTKEDTSSQIPPKPIEDYISQKDQVEAVERPSEASKPQNGQKEVEPKLTPTMQTDEKPQKGHEEVEPKSTSTMLTRMQTAENPPKDQEELESKPTPTMTTKTQTDQKPQKGQEEFEPKSAPTMETKIKTDEQPSIGKEETGPKPTITTTITRSTEGRLQEENGVKTTLVTTKEQLVEKETDGTSGVDDAEKDKIPKKGDQMNPSESRKPVKGKEKGSFKEKETRAQKLSTKEGQPSAPKVPKEEKESNNITIPKKERKSKEDTKDTEGSGIKELVGSASHVVTRIVEGKLNEQDKHLVANIGAAVLVIAALGAYVSFRFSS